VVSTSTVIAAGSVSVGTVLAVSVVVTAVGEVSADVVAPLAVPGKLPCPGDDPRSASTAAAAPIPATATTIPTVSSLRIQTHLTTD
jgi:hypothetical protein